MMAAGQANEQIVYNWLLACGYLVIDHTDDSQYQADDIDFTICSCDGESTIEIKSDKWISDDGNFCFELCRINHYAADNWYYEGWGYRSKADYIIVRNPKTGEAYQFNFHELRQKVGQYVAYAGKNLKITIIETDNQKTTICLLIPMAYLQDVYYKHSIKEKKQDA